MHDDNEIKDWEGEDAIDLRHLWAVIDRRKWLIAAFALGMALAAAAVVMLITPVYKATATLLIESEQANVVSIEEIYGLEMRDQQYYDTQYEILRSRPIAEAVVNSERLAERDESYAPGPGAGWLTRQSHRARTRLANWLGSEDASQKPSYQEFVDSYMQRVEIEPVGKTQLVRVHFQSPNPGVAAELANAHARAYIDSILDARLEVTQSASSWMAGRVDDLRQKLIESERRLQDYREQEGLIDAQGVQSLPAKEINELTSRLVEARRRLSDARIAFQQVRAEGSGSLESVPSVLRDEAVRRFRQAEATAEQKVAELAKRYGPMHPKMQAAMSELEQASENVRRQQRTVAGGIEADYRAAQSDVAQLERELNTAKERFQEVGRKQGRLAELQKEVDVNRQLYDVFYNRMQETAQTGDLESVNARIMSPAILPLYPFKPKKRMIVVLVLIASVLIGIVAALLDESLNNTLRSSDDVEEKLGQSLLGMIPLLKNGVAKGPRTAHAFFSPDEGEFAEAVRTVRTGLSLSSLDVPYKLTLVTSSVSGEGKSTVALNLAYAFGQVESVLVIDGDLRRPTVGKELDIARSHPGLSELLSGRAELEECIVSRGREKLDVLSTGFIPPNPLELVSSRRMGEVLAELRKRYDRIIIDSPPVLPVSDAVVLSKYVDAVVYVIKADDTAVHQVRHGLNRLERVDAPVVGVTLNQLDFRKAEKYSDYGYGGYYESYTTDKSEKLPEEETPESRLRDLWSDPSIDRRRKVS